MVSKLLDKNTANWKEKNAKTETWERKGWEKEELIPTRFLIFKERSHRYFSFYFIIKIFFSGEEGRTNPLLNPASNLLENRYNSQSVRGNSTSSRVPPLQIISLKELFSKSGRVSETHLFKICPWRDPRTYGRPISRSPWDSLCLWTQLLRVFMEALAIGDIDQMPSVISQACGWSRHAILHFRTLAQLRIQLSNTSNTNW